MRGWRGRGRDSMARIRGCDVREVSRRFLIWVVVAHCLYYLKHIVIKKALWRSTPFTHMSHDDIKASEGYCSCIALVIMCFHEYPRYPEPPVQLDREGYPTVVELASLSLGKGCER